LPCKALFLSKTLSALPFYLYNRQSFLKVNENMKTRWYQEPWAWLVVILPVISVVVSINVAIIASKDPDALVVGDYYKQGKAINQKLTLLKQAEKLGINFDLKANDKELVLKPTGIEKTFPLLNVHFYHSTLDERDFEVKLTPDGNGYFRLPLEQELTGKWTLTITPFDSSWKLQNTFYFPQLEFMAVADHIRHVD
jgi:hypothetical protein